MARLTKKALKKQGTEIITMAKKIRKKHPKMEWKTAMKKAGAAYRKKHKK